MFLIGKKGRRRNGRRLTGGKAYFLYLTFFLLWDPVALAAVGSDRQVIKERNRASFVGLPVLFFRYVFFYFEHAVKRASSGGGWHFQPPEPQSFPHI